ncbi:MAG: tetratricopeptide repeat protein, partial [Myxococcota bacterium]
GGAVCSGCHLSEWERWRGSHHDLAMQEAVAETVLGDFEGATFSHYGVTSRFHRRGGKFFVHTDGPDGVLRDYEIAYTFGVDPLQQVLVASEGGRLQALGLAWDTRAAAEGGQRWFHLYPDEPIPHGDELHWTGLQQNWNHMCAACHSTNVHKNYRIEGERFETTWSEIDVACESCHGPGSVHVAWAEARGTAEPRADLGLTVRFPGGADWVFEPGAPVARRSRPSESDAELETCGRCHSRAALLREEPARGQALLDTHRVALLDEGLYHADGQILEEVYVYGSFLQSRMHAAGVRCSDCHDPHSLAIEGEPDEVCGRCHRSEFFAGPDHHRHPPGSRGTSCIACHMPARTYMVIDERHDHSFRVPRPDLTVEIGVPNTCNDCHADRSPKWAAQALEGWLGTEREKGGHYGETLQAGRRFRAGAEGALGGLIRDRAQPGIARATALQLIGPLLTSRSLDAVGTGLRDPDPLVRRAAISATERLELASRLGLASRLLRDPVRAVRLEAERVLRDVPPELWTPADHTALASVQTEFRAVQRLHGDRPEAWLNLGLLHTGLGEVEDARAAYERAIRIAPWFIPAAVNLADLYRRAGQDEEGGRVLRDGIARAPENAELWHALGLLLVRQGRAAEAIDGLERAAELGPEQPRYGYVHAVALHSGGDTTGALRILEPLHRRFPGDREIEALLNELRGRD